MTILPTLRTKLLGDEVLPIHLLKGKRAYEQWATAGGTVAVEEVFPYDDLSDLDRQRWVFFAKAYGDPAHDHSFAVPAPKDVRNYPEAAQITTRPELWDYLSEVPGHVSSPWFIPYPQWVDERMATRRQHWWQFNRPKTVDPSKEAWKRDIALRQSQQSPTPQVNASGPHGLTKLL